MKIRVAGGETENGVAVGNIFDKYNSVNPVVRRIMKGFSSSFLSFVEKVSPRTIFEVGCGEGYWILTLNALGYEARGCDVSPRVVEMARENAHRQRMPEALFSIKSIYDLTDADSADLIVCCEVFENLEDPEKGLRSLRRCVGEHLILSVPREPLWRVCNMVRGRYWKSLGNTPGHIQHWAKKGFLSFVSREFEIREVASPFPWTMLLCHPRQ